MYTFVQQANEESFYPLYRLSGELMNNATQETRGCTIMGKNMKRKLGRHRDESSAHVKMFSPAAGYVGGAAELSARWILMMLDAFKVMCQRTPCTHICYVERNNVIHL